MVPDGEGVGEGVGAGIGDGFAISHMDPEYPALQLQVFTLIQVPLPEQTAALFEA